MKIYRVIVRGQFAELDNATTAELLELAPAHDIFKSAFTAEGILSYDDQLVAFNVRYEVRDSGGELSSDEIAADSIARTAADLESRGIGHKHMRAAVTDMASYWQRA